MVVMQNCQDPNHAKQKSVGEVWQPNHQYTDLASMSLICQYQLSPQDLSVLHHNHAEQDTSC